MTVRLLYIYINNVNKLLSSRQCRDDEKKLVRGFKKRIKHNKRFSRQIEESRVKNQVTTVIFCQQGDRVMCSMEVRRRNDCMTCHATRRHII